MTPEWLVVCHTMRPRDQAVREIIAKQIMSLTQPTNFLVVDGNEGNAQTLNAMIAQLPSRSETYFVTIDDDMVPSPGWQEAIAQAHRDIPDLVLVGLDLSNSLWGQSYMIKVPEITECGGTRIRFTEGVNIGGCFIASTRELAIEIGAIPIIPGTKYHVYQDTFRWLRSNRLRRRSGYLVHGEPVLVEHPRDVAYAAMHQRDLAAWGRVGMPFLAPHIAKP